MVDTARDYRVLVAEHALGLLERRVKGWGLPWPLNKGRALELLESSRKSLLKVKYSFLPADMLVESDDLARLVSNARELAGLVLPPEGFQVPRETRVRLALAEMRWALSILIGLPQRFRLGEENHPEYAVDVVGVEVTRVEPLTERLRVTRASAGIFALTIVTNIQGIRVGEVRAAAILPPVEFHGVVSEAMYASEPLGDKGLVGKRVPRRLLSGEVAAQVRRLVGERR